MDLSVLICSVDSRYDNFGMAIQRQVWDQYNALPESYRDRIEILMLTDNRKMMLGQKRNVLVDMAQGRYVQFIDDDDRIEPDMFRALLDATGSDADVITFDVSVSLNGGAPKVCRYSKDFAADRNLPNSYERLPNHICCVKRELAEKVSFPNLVYGEDSAYSKLLHPMLKTEYRIDRVLYHYDFSEATTVTQKKNRTALRMRQSPPIVDVIILSRANTPGLRAMTQRAIDTCIAGANSLAVNVIVMEQESVPPYMRARTVRAPNQFHYNSFANHAAMIGSAKWIMVANNDLVFHDGWLHHLLAAEHPVVSPKCPQDSRQTHIVENTTGWQVGTHFSGWCFMLLRELWERMGGFDECVSFWCSDNVVVEQLRELGYQPMLVPASQVTHRRSVTLKRDAAADDLTWGQVDIFNRKYVQDLFAGDPRYIKWLNTVRTP